MNEVHCRPTEHMLIACSVVYCVTGVWLALGRRYTICQSCSHDDTVGRGAWEWWSDMAGRHRQLVNGLS